MTHRWPVTFSHDDSDPACDGVGRRRASETVKQRAVLDSDYRGWAFRVMRAFFTPLRAEA